MIEVDNATAQLPTIAGNVLSHRGNGW